MGEWLKKGSSVFLEGRLQTRTYDDSNGVKKWITEVVATDMEMLGKKGDSGGGTSEEAVPEDVPDAEGNDADLPF